MRAAMMFILALGRIGAGSLAGGYALRGVLAPQAHFLLDVCTKVRR